MRCRSVYDYSRLCGQIPMAKEDVRGLMHICSQSELKRDSCESRCLRTKKRQLQLAGRYLKQAKPILTGRNPQENMARDGSNKGGEGLCSAAYTKLTLTRGVVLTFRLGGRGGGTGWWVEGALKASPNFGLPGLGGRGGGGTAIGPLVAVSGSSRSSNSSWATRDWDTCCCGRTGRGGRFVTGCWSC